MQKGLSYVRFTRGLRYSQNDFWTEAQHHHAFTQQLAVIHRTRATKDLVCFQILCISLKSQAES